MNERLIVEFIARVRWRWRTVVALRASARALLAISLVLAAALVVSRWAAHSTVALVAVACSVVVLTLAAAAWGISPLRRAPSDQRVARFVEEADPSLEDRLASAVTIVSSREPSDRPAFADRLLTDAAQRLAHVDPASVVPTAQVRRSWIEAGAAVALFVAIVFTGRTTARQAADAVSLSFFPSRVTLQVSPGNARIKLGSSIAIDARLAGNSAPALVRLLRDDSAGDQSGNASAEPAWHAAEMAPQPGGAYRLSFEPGASFRYRVTAGAVTSPVYTVIVARPPRVARIDLDYTFPKELGLAPRSEEDTGDIYAPAGTDVRVRVHTDRPVASGRMMLTGGKAIDLTRESDTVFSTSLAVTEDGSYRVALADAEGLASTGDTEYFIRTLEDRPPDVHVLHPARDRDVTRLEEVDIQARADDDFGLASMALVYSVKGGPEKVVPISIPPRAVSATGTATLYLEDLDVAPGDFVSYYVRARDIGRGKRSSETKSDLFFLQVRPFDQEFTMASSQAGGSGNQQIDDLVQAQKDVVVSTWKLDRRGAAAGATSPDDVHAVAKAESQLKDRVEETSSSFRESTMRDPRARGPQRSVQPSPGESDMTAAASAMGTAAATLDRLKTADAVPPEMDALNHLLRAQAQVKQRQLQTQQAGNGRASNRSNLDLSNLFDRELQRQQRSNYESKPASDDRQDDSSLLDKVRDLARRQDELNERQKELSTRRDQLSAAEAKRDLEQLTREQSDLRQQAEELARTLSQGSQSSPGSRGSQGPQESAMRSAADAMAKAASSLRQQNPSAASQQGSDAADRLRALADQMGSGGGADSRRRALGDMQLEARQMADAERQIASTLESAGRGGAGQASSADTLRRLAGEQDQLAGRASRVESGLRQQSLAAGTTPAALTGAARDADRQRLSQRMQQAAGAMRSAAQNDQTDRQRADVASAQASAERQMAADLDRLADTLAVAAAPDDKESQALAARRAQLDAERSELDRLANQIAQAQPGSDMTKLREQYANALRQTQQLIDQMKRDDPSLAQGAGLGFTFEGQGMVLSAPGTEAFKQDFAKWEQLRLRAIDALAKAETSIDQKLQAKPGNERLAAGVDDVAPSGYEQQVNSYFKALADRKR